uniref:Uncharacterized protein n=1 Tax=Micrurus lemniscatus lemniscatus TaxID=129467 RepID=A0A2D4JR37_MICLE
MNNALAYYAYPPSKEPRQHIIFSKIRDQLCCWLFAEIKGNTITQHCCLEKEYTYFYKPRPADMLANELKKEITVAFLNPYRHLCNLYNFICYKAIDILKQI